MDLDKFLKSLKGRPLDASIESLVAKKFHARGGYGPDQKALSILSRLLKRRQISGPEDCALATAHILLHVVAKSKWSNVDSLLQRIENVGRKLVLARPQELVIGNIVRRVLGLIRDEAEEDRGGNNDDSMSDVSNLPGDEPQHATSSMPTSPRPRLPPRLTTLTSTGSFHVPQSMFNMLQDSPRFAGSSMGTPFGRGSGASTPMSHSQVANISALRSEVIEGIEELKDEIVSGDEQISSYAEVQIHPGSFVLVYRPNATVEKFLLAAAKRRKFTVLIAGVGPSRATTTNHQAAPYASLRKQLHKFGVQSIVMAGTGVMAYMPKVNVVVLNSQAVTANGAVLADGGAAVAARAAHEYNKTVIVLGAVYKLCPEDEPDLDVLVDLGNPQSLMSYHGQMVEVDVSAMSSEYISPELVDLYISNLGPHCRDHLQGIVGDHYKIEDVEFSAQ
ncbi:hypothetical protein M406DRAFT_108186 [Cryphonectria parasitica EP155]|uniref:Translation initiation factor eIF2B subunit beta n=1 Tax=Cryphonectria parasitica (strain ATCC 38755 / EP155) TaxID=660469 RepID=A0A9P5CIP6_CRYP1|nr:uncharacterized protein M406DRAFT_108186 [Cryphonectria parasitica EP155]KAF3760653.1 hypothetical protein M406DRAFT_108186 [Cryphonectria parasitica EP155]